MVIISDTTTISNLLIINKLYILQKLYNKIIIPRAVFTELQKLKNYNRNLSEIIHSSWIVVEDVKNIDWVLELSTILDKGEAEAIVLSKELNADLLIIDETKGRNLAKKLNITIIGLLGILIIAKNEKLIDSVENILNELKTKSGFWISNELQQKILALVGEK